MELHRQWELLLEKMREKGIKLLQAQKLVQYLRECEDVMDWINDKEAIVTSEELGQDLEHVEVLQKKFEEFQTDLAAHEERVNEVNQFAAKLIQLCCGCLIVLNQFKAITFRGHFDFGKEPKVADPVSMVDEDTE
ncbi:Spectrin alpha chain, brain [Heterocephalus glaber]|uniref:Spectrin alpha chain, brain n=1 Tax=Heterocephalus glaber TaxID=10181 RepID=G5BKC6_HETGA|nr:Spectrin alpha chain, brain [Heterocephalus glaber]